MSEKIKTVSFKFYAVVWSLFLAAYAFWMIVPMDYDTYPVADSGLYKPLYYWLWIAVSFSCLALMFWFVKRFLYGKEITKALRVFCLVSLIYGFIYITWYGAFDNPGYVLTASVVGLSFPWHFKMWGIFSALSVFPNILYMYRLNNYNTKTGVFCASLGCAALYITVNVPSAGESTAFFTDLRCGAHWFSALAFAAFAAAAIVIFYLNRIFKEKDKRYLVPVLILCVVLLTMLAVLVFVGKSGIIETLPMWLAYVLLFLTNFTKFFKPKASLKKEKVIA